MRADRKAGCTCLDDTSGPCPKHRPRRAVPFSFQEPTSKQRSVKQEKRAAKIVGGRVQPRSGAGDWKKADVACARFLIENKTTKAKSFRLTVEDLDKITAHAWEADKDPAFWITFEGERPKDWIAVPLDVFRQMLK